MNGKTRLSISAAAVTAAALIGGAVLFHGAAKVGVAGPGTSEVSLSVAKTYSTLSQLRQDADVVALVRVDGAPRASARIADVPTVDVPLLIERVIKGDAAAGDRLVLAQVGDLEGKVRIAEPVPPILQEAKRYVVYLNRQFPDQPQFMITGVAGVYAQSPDGGHFTRVGDVSPELPTSSALHQF